MYYSNVWKSLHGSVCNITLSSKEGIKIYSLSGFKYKNYIISEDTVFSFPHVKRINITFFGPDGNEKKETLQMSIKEFESRLITKANGYYEKFLIIRLWGGELENIPSLQFGCSKRLEIGTKVAIIGYQKDFNNLSLKTGIISSFYLEGATHRYIEFESSIKRGIPGSPLIDPLSYEVVGIVGCSMSSVAKKFSRLKTIINDNIQTLEKAKGKINICEIDPVQVFIANQNIVKNLAREMHNSAYAHNALAIPSREVTRFFKKYHHNSQFSSRNGR